MPRFRLVLGLTVVLALPSCGTDPTPPPRWYFTCGDPVCSGYQPPPGVPACSSAQAPDAACAPEGDSCDPVDSCNRLLVCATSDPTQGTGGCPISRARFKRDVLYLSDGELERVYAELRRFRLATWRYRAASPADRARLGFIIEDVEPSAAVDGERDGVDLYGYASMAVAAVQVQARQIESLRAEVAALRHRLDGDTTRP